MAVKRLRSDRVTEKDLKAFQEEAFIMRKITAHPNIGIVLLMSISDIIVVMFRGVILDPPSIVTDFCNEGSLYKKLNSNEEISMETKFKWILEIVRGMVFDMIFLHIFMYPDSSSY